MGMPPAIADLHVNRQQGGPLHLWLPVFLLWPVLLVLFVLGVVFSVLVDVFRVASGNAHRSYTRFLIGCFAALFQTRGLRLAIRNDRTDVDLEVL